MQETITNDIPEKQQPINHFIPEISEVSSSGRADRIWSYLKSMNSELKPEHHVWLQKDEPDASSSISKSMDRADGTYFSLINPAKQRRIIDNILNRKELWNAFLEKRKMTSAEFKLLSEFKPKAIAGFMKFITENGIASRYGDFFKLNENVIHEIQKLLSKKTNHL